MKRVLFILLSVFCSSSFSYALNGSIPGTGSAIDPYLIEDTADFLVFGDPANADTYCDDNIHIKLMSNLDFSEEGIFNDALINPGGEFEGFFFGNNKTISNVTIETDSSTPTSSDLGLFAGLRGGVIVDLKVSDILINSDMSISSIGGLVGSADSGSKIENCHTVARIYHDISFGPKIGGIAGSVGHGNTIIRHCSANVTIISSEDDCGGIAGYCTGQISNCHSYGSVSADGDVGGLVGTLNGGYVLQSSSSCIVESTGTGFDAVGGLVGSSNSGTIEKSFATGNVLARSRIAYAGGFAGKANADFIINCYSSGSVTTTSDRSGAFIGSISFDVEMISGCFWNKDKTGNMPWASGDEGQVVAGVTGLTTAQMKDKQIFIDAGWKFYGETAGPAPAVWYISKNMTGPGLINNSDFYNKVAKGDLNGDGTVDINDFVALSQNWMSDL